MNAEDFGVKFSSTGRSDYRVGCRTAAWSRWAVSQWRSLNLVARVEGLVSLLTLSHRLQTLFAVMHTIIQFL